jgi:ABC-type sugar transport system permease subunit
MAEQTIPHPSAPRPKRGPAIQRPTGIQRQREKPQGMDYVWILIFLLPFLVLYTGFTLWPLAATVYYSFFDWDGFRPLTDFVGFENYLTIMQDPVFWLSFRNTVFFSLANTAIKLPLSLLAAVALTRKWLKGKNIFRTVFFSPLVIPVAMAGMIFSLLLNPANGAVNDLLQTTGLLKKPIDFLGNGKTAMWSLIIVSVWQIFGQYMIYWMAALQNVPQALYEAAEIDGANEWDKLVKITLPVIRPVATIITFLAFVNGLKVFGLVVTMTSGGPGQQTYVVPYFIYNQAFSSIPFRYGYASAVAVFFGLVILAAVGLQGYFVGRTQAN